MRRTACSDGIYSRRSRTRCGKGAAYTEETACRALCLPASSNAIAHCIPSFAAACRIICRWACDRWLWQAIVAAYTVGTPAIDVVSAPNVPAWDTIIAKARDSLNEHDIKLVDVARDEEAVYGGPWYIHAAARRMRLL